MLKFIAAVTTAAALSLAASAGFAQTSERYILNDRVMGGDNAEGAALIDCPDGSFVRIGDRVFQCGDTGASFVLAEPEAGSMMGSGQAWPEGSMRMSPMDNETGDGEDNDPTSAAGSSN